MNHIVGVLSGGYVDYGETLESAGLHKIKEETCLEDELIEQSNVYLDPNRDTRHHKNSIVLLSRADGIRKAAKDA